MNNDKNIGGLFNLNTNLVNLKGSWLSVPPRKIFPVNQV
jgi:hypothetical protein